ncbi:odorant receptor 67c-like [Epargyreus clarus]|uniref:odorant receptor 67c-like n=1 Tax=Epargyreus clarus TaxID=520877 RepID=UPI003C2EE800
MKLKNGLSFENSIKLPKISLEFAGIDIYPRQNNPGVIGFIRTWLFYFNLIWLYPDVIGEVYRVIDGFQSGKTFDELSMSAPCAAICMLSTAKTFPLYFNRDALQKVVEKLTILHPDQESIKEDVKRRILEEAAKILKKIIFIFFNLFAAVGITFCISPCVAMMYNYYTTGTTDFMFPFRIKYFFDPNTSVRWPFVYLHQFWSTIIVIMNIFGSDTLLYAFCTYLRMHFRLLCHRYEDIVSESMTETRENFIEAVKLHQELIRLVNQIEMLYTKSNLWNILSSSLLICLSGFNITFIDDKVVVLSFATFLILSLSQIFLLCFFGDILSTSSNEVYQAVYNCKWYETDQSFKRSVLIVMIRAQTPCKLTAMNFVDLNLPAFTTILSRSWSYFALLKTMFD